MQQNIQWALLAAMTPFLVEARGSTTRSVTETVFLPPRETGSASNIYASVITKDASKTEYLLACQTNFGSSYTCDGDFHGVTVTYEKSAMDIAFKATTYDCELGSSAVCATKTKSSDDERTTTLDASESSSWMTAITVLEVKKTTSKSSAASTETQSSGNLCKRKTRGSGSGDSDGDSGSSSGGSSSSKGSSGKNRNGDDCSGGSGLTRDWTVLALSLGTLIAFNLM
ncbi:hypothetical protein ACJZ2D_009637 [Fusarium nematophilum]